MTDRLACLFVHEGEAARAATQLRAAGLDDADIAIETLGGEGVPRDEEAGVPDSASSLKGLSGDDAEPPARVRMTVSLEHARLDRAEIEAMIRAAGGRIG